MKRLPPPSPNVAELSAPMTTPSLQRMPTMAVTVAGPSFKTSGVLTPCFRLFEAGKHRIGCASKFNVLAVFMDSNV